MDASRFTPGQRVRITNTDGMYGVEVGDVATVLPPDANSRMFGWVNVDAGANGQYARPDQLEPVTADSAVLH